MTKDFTRTALYQRALLAPLRDLADAACVDADPALFDGDRATERTLPAAQAWCQRCPVAQTCLDGALVRKDSGVWGGRLLVDGQDATDVVRQGA